MAHKISLLGESHSFMCIDLQLSERELALVDQLKFDKLPADKPQLQYSRFGDLHLLREELPEFLNSIGQQEANVVDATVEVIARVTQNLVNASAKDSAWVCVRAFHPTAEYDMPRWHMDGRYYDLQAPLADSKMVFKFAATLKGSSTLLYEVMPEQRNLFNIHWNEREFLSQLVDVSRVTSPKVGEGILFVVANPQLSAVHSEPPIHTNRLFFSVLVGDQSQIDELYARWHPQKATTGKGG